MDCCRLKIETSRAQISKVSGIFRKSRFLMFTACWLGRLLKSSVCNLICCLIFAALMWLKKCAFPCRYFRYFRFRQTTLCHSCISCTLYDFFCIMDCFWYFYLSHKGQSLPFLYTSFHKRGHLYFHIMLLAHDGFQTNTLPPNMKWGNECYSYVNLIIPFLYVISQTALRFSKLCQSSKNWLPRMRETSPSKWQWRVWDKPGPV